eukprot:3587461-Amphidinium_carterae.1
MDATPGNFRLCYTPDGTFSAGDQTEYKNNLVDVIIEVIGVQGSHSTEPHAVRPLPHGSCA